MYRNINCIISISQEPEGGAIPGGTMDKPDIAVSIYLHFHCESLNEP